MASHRYHQSAEGDVIGELEVEVLGRNCRLNEREDASGGMEGRGT